LGRKTAANKTGSAIGYVCDNAGGKILAYLYDPADNRSRTPGWKSQRSESPPATTLSLFRSIDRMSPSQQQALPALADSLPGPGAQSNKPKCLDLSPDTWK